MRLDPLRTKHPIGMGMAIVVVCTAIMAVLPSWFGGFAGPFTNRLVQAFATGGVFGVLMWRLVRFRQGRGRSVDFLLFDPLGFLQAHRLKPDDEQFHSAIQRPKEHSHRDE